MTALKDAVQSQLAEEAQNLGAAKPSGASIYAEGQKAEREPVRAGGEETLQEAAVAGKTAGGGVTDRRGGGVTLWGGGGGRGGVYEGGAQATHAKVEGGPRAGTRNV